MRQFLRGITAAVLLAAILCLGAFAAETVIYENDFSDPATLADFKQYRVEWEIRDGGLYLTDKLDASVPNQQPATTFAHIIYQAEKALDEYIVEVDYMNIQTAGGIIFNADKDAAGTGVNAFYGYFAFIANDATKGAFGSGDTKGDWKGNINVGAPANCNLGTNAHIKVTVKGGMIHVEITNLDSGKSIYDYTYKIGSSAQDANWVEGTVGLRMRAEYAANFAVSAGNAYFDNLRITTANEATIGEPAPVTPAEPAKTEKLIDTSSLETVYTNDFADADALKDFKAYRGSFTVRDGKLYLASATGTHAFLLYEGDKAISSMEDYVLDVDMYNTQTQAGAIVRADLDHISDTDNGFCGYTGFISFDGKLGAVGYGKPDGSWGGNIKVSGGVITPGSDIHLQVAVKGDKIQYVITDLAGGKELWSYSGTHTAHTAGSFGFRLYGKVRDGLDNKNTAFDNLKISRFAEKTTAPESKFTATRTYENRFADVPENAWFYTYVKTAYEYALANGTSAAGFSPDGTFTVAQALTAAANIHKAYTGKAIDTAGAANWYDPYVNYCVANGIITANQFADYNKNITRGEMAVVFANILPEAEYKAIRTYTLSDMNDTLPSAAAVRKLAEAGIVGGSNGKYKPDDPIKRSEACVIFTRIAVASMRDAKAN